jgi:hypothetical protein
MLSLVLSKYQDMTDAHAASSESGSSALVVEQRRMFAKQISELKENIAFLLEQLATWFADESMKSIRFRHQRICCGQLLTVVLCLSGISYHSFINCNFAVIYSCSSSCCFCDCCDVEVRRSKGRAGHACMRWFRKQWIVKLFFKCNTAENSGEKLKFHQTRSLPSRAETAQHWNSCAMQRTRWP